MTVKRTGPLEPMRWSTCYPDCRTPTGRDDGRATVTTVETSATIADGRTMASASAGTGTSPPTTQCWDRGEVIGASVLALAGIAWFGWAQDDPPSSWVPYLAAGSVASALLLMSLLVILVRRRTTTGSPMADPGVRRGYWATVMVEVLLIVGGNVLLAALGHPEYDAAWTLFVVGVHFVPLARIFNARGLALTGVVTAVVAVAAACLGLASDLTPSAVAGAGAGVVFLGYAAWVLVRGRRPRP